MFPNPSQSVASACLQREGGRLSDSVGPPKVVGLVGFEPTGEQRKTGTKTGISANYTKT